MLATAERTGGAVELYQVAAQNYRAGLETMTREVAPLEWAMVQRNLGMVLGIGLASIAFSQTFSRLTHGLDMKDFTPVHTGAFMGALRTVYLAAAGAGFLGAVISAMRGRKRP